MKKLLLIGLILTICMLAIPQGVLAVVDGDSGKTSGTAEIKSTVRAVLDLTVTPDAGTNDWELISGVPNYYNYYNFTHGQKNATAFIVESNQKWYVQASDAGTVHTGHMVGTPDTKFLAEPMRITTGTEGYKDLEVAKTIADGVSGTKHFERDLLQVVHNDDWADTGYSITITFTATPVVG